MCQEFILFCSSIFEHCVSFTLVLSMWVLGVGLVLLLTPLTPPLPKLKKKRKREEHQKPHREISEDPDRPLWPKWRLKTSAVPSCTRMALAISVSLLSRPLIHAYIYKCVFTRVVIVETSTIMSTTTMASSSSASKSDLWNWSFHSIPRINVLARSLASV